MGATGQRITVHVETRPDGCREFRRDPMDVQTVDILLQDYCGRVAPLTVHASAVLLMVPAGASLGAFVFEPTVPPVRDADTGKPYWIQRIVLGQHEVYDMIETAVESRVGPKRLIEFPRVVQ